jgi:hypothetical protein
MALADDIAAALVTLTTSVTNTDGVVASAVVAFQGIAAQMTVLANNPAAIITLASQLDTSAQALAAAVRAAPTALLSDVAGAVLIDDISSKILVAG